MNTDVSVFMLMIFCCLWTDRAEIERKRTEWMSTVYEWSKNVDVYVFENKTVTMLMKESMTAGGRSRVRMSGKLIMYEEYVKYLGVSVSEQMYFKEHLERIRDKV